MSNVNHTPGEEMSPQQIDPWMEQLPKSEPPRTDPLDLKADPIESQQAPLGYVPPERRDAGANQPTQVEAEWHPPELSEKKIDKTRDLPHSREFDH